MGGFFTSKSYCKMYHYIYYSFSIVYRMKGNLSLTNLQSSLNVLQCSYYLCVSVGFICVSPCRCILAACLRQSSSSASCPCWGRWPFSVVVACAGAPEAQKTSRYPPLLEEHQPDKTLCDSFQNSHEEGLRKKMGCRKRTYER